MPCCSLDENERRVRRAATVTLGLLLAAHTLMETARDALFLANIPVERLPWVYIVVALLALGIFLLTARGTQGVSSSTGWGTRPKPSSTIVPRSRRCRQT